MTTQRDRSGGRGSDRRQLGSNDLEQYPGERGDAMPTADRVSEQMRQDDPDFRYGTQWPQSRGGSSYPGQQGAPAQQGGGQSARPEQRDGQRAGGSWRPGEYADAQANGPGYRTAGSQHPGQLGYSQGGGAHDNWGAFEGSQQRQSPGYGQDEPWQHHHHDADYLRWREEHLRQLDEEYAHWRRERYGKFAEEFSQWRERQRANAPDSAQPRADDSAPPAKGKPK